MAQWSTMPVDPTSLAGWFTQAGMAEIRRRRVQLLKQQSSPQTRHPTTSFSGVYCEQRGEGRGDREPREEVLAPDGIGSTSGAARSEFGYRGGGWLEDWQLRVQQEVSEKAVTTVCVKAVGEKPRMNSIHIRFRPEASGVHCAGVEGRENRQPEVFPACVTSQEPAVQMGSMAVIKWQRVGGKEAIPQGQRLWAGGMGGKPVIRGQSIQACGSMGTASDLSPIEMELRKEILYKHCGQMYVKLMDLVELHVSFKKFNGKMRVLTHEKGNKDFIIGTDLLFRNAQMNFSTNSQESVFCDGVVEDEILCEQGEEKGLTLAASPPEERQEGMCETDLPEGSPELSADALSELPLPNCSELEGEGDGTEGLTSLPDSDLQQEPEVSEKPITAGYLEMQAGLLKESVDFPQGDAMVTTQPVKAVYIDLADPVTVKSSSIPLQPKGDGGKVQRDFFLPDMHKDLLEFC
uniref:Uncharacterized protein n=1 Tax=Sphaerodactylus townsendi TaxID=933632 RepID=A0ACB8EV48_9SAUR